MTDIRIDQIDLDRDHDGVAFEPYASLSRWQDSPDVNASLYETVFKGEIEAKDIEDIYRIFNTEKPEGYDILLQKRSEEKDSFPGMYDTSSAGHIPAGDEPLQSALRELKEELGLTASPEELKFAGTFRIQYEKEFHGRLFRDNEVTRVYVYDKPVNIQDLTLQESEVSEVRWFDLDKVWGEIHRSRERFCVPTAGLKVLREYLG